MKASNKRTDPLRGSMAIVFVGLFLPLLFFLFSLSLDVATYYTDQSKVQAALDETALYAYRFLPNIPAARAAATSYAQRFAGLGGLEIEVTDSLVKLKVERRSQLTFAKLVGVSDASLPLSVVSRVRGSPIDAFITLDTSSAVAPSFDESGWGDAVEWPAAQYFDDLGGVSARSKTQRCFNPIFSALKNAAIDSYRYFGASSVNAVGLGFYTGNVSSPLTAVRSVAALPLLPSENHEVSFVGFSDPYVGPALCAAAAENEQSSIKYQFKALANGFPSRGDLSARPIARINPATRSLDPAYAPYLQGEDTIWSQPSGETRGAGFGNAFRQSLLHILAAERSHGRGGLVGKPARMLLWLAAQLPSESGVAFGSVGDDVVRASIAASFSELAQGFGDTGLTIFYVIIRNPYTGFSPPTEVLSELQAQISAAATEAGLPAGKVVVRVFKIDTPDDLTQHLARWIALVNKTSVVAL